MAAHDQPNNINMNFPQSSFYEFALLLLLCAAAGVRLLRLCQPLLIAYIVVGPTSFGWVAAHDPAALPGD
ncbi:MAG: hypothetical protein MUP33_13170 [Polaromonas sp.]|nr:hypothetical protein [Polaromonas sp.]